MPEVEPGRAVEPARNTGDGDLVREAAGEDEDEDEEDEKEGENDDDEGEARWVARAMAALVTLPGLWILTCRVSSSLREKRFPQPWCGHGCGFSPV